MLEKPDFSDDALIACLRDEYRLAPVSLAFLPLGNEAGSWVYKAACADGRAYLVKLKKGLLYPPSVAVPAYLRECGIAEVVAPVQGIGLTNAISVGGFTIIVYPFIEGDTGMARGMTDRQWIRFGAALKAIHATAMPPGLRELVGREDFMLNPRWLRVIAALRERMTDSAYADPLQRELAAFWRARRQEIDAIVKRAQYLGGRLQGQPAEFVLCHTDIHAANILLDPAGGLHIVDWERPLLAPRERDLMFVLRAGAGSSVAAPSRAERLFFQGYGHISVDALTLAYYRYEWVVQEFGDYGERLFLSQEGGAETRRDAARGFIQLFQPGDVVEAAYQADASLRQTPRSLP